MVEDSKGDTTRVSVLNPIPEEFNAIFPIDTTIALREPTYAYVQYETASQTMVLLYSPSDIIFVDDVPNKLPKSVQASNSSGWVPSSARSVEDWKADGAQAFRKKR